MRLWTKLAALVIFVSGTALAGQFAGWITDAKCAQTGDYLGERHKKEVSPSNPIVFVNDLDKKIYTVTNPDKVKEAVGKRVSLQGKLKDNTIEAEEVTVMEDPAGQR